jgi:hypothetical protein
MKSKSTGIIYSESKEEEIVSYYLKSKAKDRYTSTCKYFSITRSQLIDIFSRNSTLYNELFSVLQSTTLEAAKFNARLINRASDLIEEEKLDETQAGLITLAAKAALEIHKQISKSTQSPATTGGVSGLKKVPGV